MTRTYSLIIEGEERSYSAHVPELSSILVTGNSIEEVTERAKEAIQIYWETIGVASGPNTVRREIEVELSAG